MVDGSFLLYLHISIPTALIVVSLVSVIAVTLLFIYCEAPWTTKLPFNLWYVEDEKAKEVYTRDMTAEAILPEPTIHLPWKRLPGGYINIQTKDEREWLEIDSLLPRQLYMMNRALIAASNSLEPDGRVFAIHPEYEEGVWGASFELLHQIVSNLTIFFPGVITLSDEGAEAQHMISGHRWNISREKCGKILGEGNLIRVHPLMIARQLIGDDIAIMMRSSEGLHVLAAAIISFPDEWKLEEKLGLPLAAIHYPVNVLNTAQESMENHTVPSNSPLIRSMEYFFNSMYETENKKKIFERFNWTFQQHPYLTNRFDDICSCLSENLQKFLSNRLIFGPHLEARFRNLLRLYIVNAANFFRRWFNLPQLETYLRSERQTLRVLPNSNAVAFLIRTQVIILDTLYTLYRL